jgi:hypothetical protein
MWLLSKIVVTDTLTSAMSVATIFGDDDVNDTCGYYHCSDGSKCVCDYNDLPFTIVLFCSSEKRAKKIKLAAAQDHKVSKKCTEDKGENEPTEMVSRKEKKGEESQEGTCGC